MRKIIYHSINPTSTGSIFDDGHTKYNDVNFIGVIYIYLYIFHDTQNNNTDKSIFINLRRLSRLPHSKMTNQRNKAANSFSSNTRPSSTIHIAWNGNGRKKNCRKTQDNSWSFSFICQIVCTAFESTMIFVNHVIKLNIHFNWINITKHYQICHFLNWIENGYYLYVIQRTKIRICQENFPSYFLFWSNHHNIAIKFHWS